jgi:hypothetical protein
LTPGSPASRQVVTCLGEYLHSKLRVVTLDESVVGIGWYAEDDWPELRRVSADRDRLELTWADWKRSAEAMLQTLRARGVVVRAVPIDVAKLVAWCWRHERLVDGDARAAYVAEQVSTPKK